jgi:hypothetical protein
MTKTYSLREVADMVLPAEWTDSERWFAGRLNRREIRGYRVGRVWRMTEAHVDDLIERYSNTVKPKPAPEPEAFSFRDALSPRSRSRLLSRWCGRSARRSWTCGRLRMGLIPAGARRRC